MDHSPVLSPKHSLCTDFLAQYSQDSGNSMTCSDPSGGSNDVPNLINFDNFVTELTIVPNKKSLLDEYDPLLNIRTNIHPNRHTVVSTTSVDSLFSDAVNSITSGFSSSPEAHQQVSSPRYSITTGQSPHIIDHIFVHQSSVPICNVSYPSPSSIRPRPRSARSSVDPPDISSVPSSRSMTPRLQSTSSPTGSVQSLPQYPTYSEDLYPLYSDSSNNSSLLDLSIFDDPVVDDEGFTFNFDTFGPPSLLPP